MPDIQCFTTGGTIDKVYFDALSEFEVGETALHPILREANVTLDIAVTPLMRKDSLELTDDDRSIIRAAVEACTARRILITHGTDTMVNTAADLREIAGKIPKKTIVLTGAMQPASLRSSDSLFNIGFAMAAVQLLPPGVYVAMNGRVFDAAHVAKDRAGNRFVATE
ncbi:MAG: asparaginase domain-containing protein [Sphingopyxis sp.]